MREAWVSTKVVDEEQIVLIPEGGNFTVQQALEVYQDLGEVLKNLGAIEE